MGNQNVLPLTMYAARHVFCAVPKRRISFSVAQGTIADRLETDRSYHSVRPIDCSAKSSLYLRVLSLKT